VPAGPRRTLELSARGRSWYRPGVRHATVWIWTAVLGVGAACHRAPPAARDSGARAGTIPEVVRPLDAAVGTAQTTLAPVRIPDAARAAPPRHAAQAGEVIRIPAGRYHLGSTPGDPGRDPSVEADGVDIEVPAFDIDALPSPNDPAQPIQTGTTRAQAASACSARGRRLCNEIEWERACRGPQEMSFPGGDVWDPARCGGVGDPGACASGFGTLVMGARFAEWTNDNLEERAVIRGGPGIGPPAVHRCAARRTAAADQAGLEVSFRCCGGPAPAQLAYPREISRPPFREEPMGLAQLSQIIATIPELARVREGLAIFSPSAIGEVLNHGRTTAAQHPEVTFTVNPVRWSPVFGEEILAFVATSTVGSFVAALYVLPMLDGHTPRYRHAASFILAGDRVSMALAYGPATREEVQWSACWNCGGEHGVVHYSREDGRAIAVQR